MIKDDGGYFAREHVFESLYNRMEFVRSDGTVGPSLRIVEDPVVVVQRESELQVATVQADKLVVSQPVAEPITLDIVESKPSVEGPKNIRRVRIKQWFGDFRRIAASFLLNM